MRIPGNSESRRVVLPASPRSALDITYPVEEPFARPLLDDGSRTYCFFAESFDSNVN